MITKLWIYHDGKLRRVDADRVRPRKDESCADLLLHGTWEQADDAEKLRSSYPRRCRNSRRLVAHNIDYGATVSECLERVNRWTYCRIAKLEQEIAEVRAAVVTEESIAVAEAARKAAKESR